MSCAIRVGVCHRHQTEAPSVDRGHAGGKRVPGMRGTSGKSGMSVLSFQDQLATLGFQHCWGCGMANEHGLRLRSAWDGKGDEALCVWQPQPYHIAAPGIVSGGIIATLID